MFVVKCYNKYNYNILKINTFVVYKVIYNFVALEKIDTTLLGLNYAILKKLFISI